MISSTPPATVRARAGAILRVTSGNFLEQFDFFLFGFYATYIAHTFFPASSEFASLMMTFAVFGAGLNAPHWRDCPRAYIDKVGRRKGLITTLSIMAAGTFLIVLILLRASACGRHCWCWLDACCRAFPPGRSLAACRSTPAEIARRVAKALYQLAIRQSAGGDYGGRRNGLCAERDAGRERHS